MKSIVLSFLFVAIASMVHATVLILDQNGNAPSGSNIYGTFPLALDAASSGDTILVIPSTSSYGNFGISIPLVIIGAGFNPDSQVPTTSKAATVTINSGQNGTAIIGMEITLINIGNGAGSLNNIMIENNKIGRLKNQGISNLASVIIRQNIFEAPVNQSPITLSTATQSDILVSNNIISRGSSGSNYYGPSVTSGGVTFDYNLFLGNWANHAAFLQLVDCYVTNNIFYGSSPGFTSASSNVDYQNNISFGGATNTFPPSGTNITATNNGSSDPDFVDLSSGTFKYLYTLDATLKTGSPALTAGIGSTEIGIYGGSSPFKNSGSVVPVVKSLLLPTTIQQGTNTTADIVVSGN